MNRVQPPARDYVPRRSGEIAASLLKAYLFFRHNTCDAGEGCLVPSNLIFHAKEVKPVTCEFYKWKSSCLLAIGLGGVLAGSIPTCCFFAAAHAALHFGLQIFAKAFWNDARSGQFPQVGNRELGKVGKNRGERREGMADQCEADVVGNGPLVMANDGRNHGSRKLFSGERSLDLRF